MRRIVSLLLTLALLAPAVPAQQIDTRKLPPPPQQPQGREAERVIRAYADLVLIDVQVTDRRGQPVKGLKLDQFVLTEDGQPQKLASFDYYDIEAIETAAAQDEQPIVVALGAVASPEKVRETVKDRRMVVLFYDLTSLQPEELLRAIDAGQKYVREQMTPADLVAVVSFGNRFSVRAPFTNDRTFLERAITRMTPGKEAQLAETQPAAAAEGEESTAEETGEAFTADMTEFNIFNTDRKLAALEGISNLLRDIPGRKSLVHFTGGVTQTGQENRSQLRSATDAANRANVTLYAVDLRGLQATVPVGDARTGSTGGTAMYSGAAVQRQMGSRQDSRETLETLASDTGGRSFFDTGDFKEVFQKVQDDASGYYLLGYYSANTRRDGKWRRVRVRVESADPSAPLGAGVRVRYREGYYAPKEYGVFTAEDRERQLEEAMRAETPRVELALALDTAQFRVGPNEVYVPVAAKLSSSALEWAEKRGRHEAEFDFAAEVREEQSGRVVGVLRDTVKVKLAADRFRTVQQQALVYQGGVILGPGTYRLKFLARENETGRIGTFEHDLVIPAAQPGRMELSSVLLSSQLLPVQKTSEVDRKAYAAEAKLERSPLEVGGERLVPSVTRVFTPQQRLYVLFHAYAPEKADVTKLRAGLVFFRNGEGLSETPMVEPVDLDPKTRTVTFRMSLPAERLAMGRYTVQAVVVEIGGEHAAFGRNYFAVRPAVTVRAGNQPPTN